MKRLISFVAGLVLVCALAVPTFSGEIPIGAAPTPTPTPATEPQPANGTGSASTQTETPEDDLTFINLMLLLENLLTAL